MKNNFTLEVLLPVNTGLGKQEFITNKSNLPNQQPQTHKLAEACWNGMVPELLPELFEGVNAKDCMMWQLDECRHTLYMQIGLQPVLPEPEYGLHPWVLAQNAWQN